jgi:hypothetical protein
MHFSRWSTLGASAAIALAVPTVALADRPGTPNGESAHICNSLNDLPQVCVVFNNTATEEVRFDVDFTVDGVSVTGAHEDRNTSPDHRPEATDLQKRPDFKPNCHGNDPRVQYCPAYEAAQHWIPNYRSDAVGAFMYGRGKPTEGRTGDKDDNDEVIRPEGFRVIGLDYGVTYCFRFKARRTSDDMVSEIWSNWACATTPAAPPPKPGPPTNVTTWFTPGGKDWRTEPPRVVIKWDPGENAGRYFVDKSPTLTAPPQEHEYSTVKMATDNKREAYDSPTSETLDNPGNPDIVYRVCAINISGFACVARSTHVFPPGTVQKPSHPIDVTIPTQASQDTNRPVPTTLPATNADQVGRPSGGFGTGMASAGGQDRVRSTACAAGYVWRVARAEDLVCVTPGARGRIRQENTNGPRHVNPAGAYGPNTCDAGYVWRDAFDGDVVCVTPEGRALARQENAEAVSHLADQGEVFRAPH